MSENSVAAKSKRRQAPLPTYKMVTASMYEEKKWLPT